MDYYKKRLIKRAFNRHIYKFLFMLLAFFICLFLYGAFHLVFGYYEFEANGNTYQLPDLPSHDGMPYYFIYDQDYTYDQDNNGDEFPLVVIFSDIDLPIIRNSSSYSIYINNTSAVSYYNAATNQWVHKSDYLDDHTYRVHIFERSYNANFSWDDLGQYVILNSNYDVYEYGSHNIVHYDDVNIHPFIINDTTEIETWTFDYLGINLGTVNFTPNKDVLTINYNGNYFWVDLSLYNIEDNVIYIPQQDLNNRIVFNENSSITFEYDSFETVPFTAYNIGSFQFTLTTYDVNELNNNADRNIQYEIMEQNKQAIAEQQKTNDLISSTDIDDDAISFPTIDVNDGGVLNAMASFFDKIYNAFVEGNLYDITIPIPYTNKNIVIPYNYTETQLTNANATWIITIIQLGWWYILGKYIIINLFEKVITIMRGSVEKVQMQSVTTKIL